MPKPLSIDLRERVLAAVAGGRSRRAAAERFGVAPSTAIKWVATWRANGRDRPLTAGGDRRSHPIETHAEAILAWLAETPDVTLAAVTADLARQRGLQVSRSTVWRFFARRAITFKKKTAHACEQERPDVARRRQAWRAGQPDLDPAQRVFVDETGTSTKMARRSGRAPRGERCRAPVPHGHWQTTTFVGALRVDGMTAPMVLDGPMHGPAFRTWVERLLVPALRPGDVVVLDNLPAHRVAGVQDAVEQAGAELRFLPPYSPDLNPIEMAFAKLKACLKRIAARTLETLWDASATALEAFTSCECRNYFTAAGYDRT